MSQIRWIFNSKKKFIEKELNKINKERKTWEILLKNKKQESYKENMEISDFDGYFKELKDMRSKNDSLKDIFLIDD